MPENEDAITIWQRVRYQVLPFTTTLNQLAVWAAIERYEIRKPVECFEKVARLFEEITAPRLREEKRGG